MDQVLQLDPVEQYAEYLADRVRLAFSYNDWHRMQFDKAPEPVTPNQAQVIIAAVVAEKHN